MYFNFIKIKHPLKNEKETFLKKKILFYYLNNIFIF